jgi:hypothetical protein
VLFQSAAQCFSSQCDRSSVSRERPSTSPTSAPGCGPELLVLVRLGASPSHSWPERHLPEWRSASSQWLASTTAPSAPCPGCYSAPAGRWLASPLAAHPVLNWLLPLRLPAHFSWCVTWLWPYLSPECWLQPEHCARGTKPSSTLVLRPAPRPVLFRTDAWPHGVVRQRRSALAISELFPRVCLND